MDKFVYPGAPRTDMRATRHPMLTLAFGLSFPRSVRARRARAPRRARFSTASGEADRRVCARARRRARAIPPRSAAKEESELLLALAPQLDDFIARLFGIEAEVARARRAPPRARAALFA